MKKRKTSKRYVRLKTIIEKMRKGGWFYPKEIADQTRIPYSTVKYDLKLGILIGIFKQEGRKERYRWVEYVPEEPMIRKAIEDRFPHGIRVHLQSKYTTTYDPFEETLKDAAIRTGNDPKDQDFRKLFYKVVKKIYANSS